MQALADFKRRAVGTWCDSPGCAPGARAAHPAASCDGEAQGKPRHFEAVRSTLACICRGKPCQKLAQYGFGAGQTCHQKRPCPTLCGHRLLLGSEGGGKMNTVLVASMAVGTQRSCHVRGCSILSTIRNTRLVGMPHAKGALTHAYHQNSWNGGCEC